eukprot:TRINITY_DN34932_c0_g1_i1.p1 TRINITY_DN34932_c0_g1~~TRINITY_DN34932_c0_g1_i1.p1  ORF type:complete len:224 (+),score=23.80 TRINITY_DN34932_c0_g1_i1:81-752(+)
MAFSRGVSSLLLAFSVAEVRSQLVCAEPGATLCADDVSVVNTTEFANDLTSTGMQVFFGKKGYDALKQIVEARLSAGAVSDDCLRCQGATVDCGVKQRDCTTACTQSSCSFECRECQQKQCSVSYACGGAAGVAVQKAYTCAAGGNAQSMTVNDALDSVPWEGNCTSRVSATNSTNSTTAAPPTAAPSATTTGTGAATSFSARSKDSGRATFVTILLVAAFAA